jgi:hypothetical protein
MSRVEAWLLASIPIAMGLFSVAYGCYVFSSASGSALLHRRARGRLSRSDLPGPVLRRGHDHPPVAGRPAR